MPNTARRATARTSTMARSRRRCRASTSGRSGVTNRPRRCSRTRAPRCRRRSPAPSATTTYAQLLAFMLQENGVRARRAAVARPRRRRSRRWRRPRGRAAAAADSHRAPPCRRLRRAPTRCDKITPVTDAMLDAPRRRRLADLAPDLRRVRLQPAEEDQQDAMSATCASPGAGRCPRARTIRRRSSTTACCSSTATATRCRRSTPRPATCSGSTRAGCRRASRRATSAASRSTASRLYVPTSDAHIVALDVKTGRVVWDQAVGDPKTGFRMTGGTLVAAGQGDGRDHRPRRGRQLHRRARCRDRQGSVALLHDRQARRAGRQHVERAAAREAQRRIGLDSRELRSGPQPRVLRARQHLRHRPAPRSRHSRRRQQRRALPGLHAGARIRTRDSSSWHFQHQANGQWDLDWAFERQVMQLRVNGAVRDVVVTAASR